MISVQTEDFDMAAEYQWLRQQAGDPGAVVTFTGLVRELYDGSSRQETAEDPVQSLTLEHYPGMTEKSLQAIVEEANARWQLLATRIIHRVGTLTPGEQIVFVGTASSHRQNAFDAAQFMMDYLKSEAPFWKKQASATGSRWIDSRDSDEEAKQRWKSSS